MEPADNSLKKSAPDKKAVFGFVGELASGKSASCSYLLKKYGAETYRFSTVLRDLLKRLYIPETRENMVKLSEALRQQFGEDALAKQMAEDILQSNARIIAIDGIRRASDIVYLKEIPSFVLVEIFADPRKRFERIKLRKENPDDAAKTWEEFQNDLTRSTEITIRVVSKNADERIDNNGDMHSLGTRLDALVKKYTEI